MLTHITLKNYKPIRHIELDLSRMTVFIGQNDSGKSSILQAVHQASQMAANRPLKDIFSGIYNLDRLRNQSTAEPIFCEFAGAFPDIGYFRWSFELNMTEETPCIAHESWDIGSDHQSMPEQTDQSRLPAPLSRFIRSAVYLHLDPNRLKQPSYSEEDIPRLEYDGSNLPSVLAAIQGLSRERFDELEKRFVSIVPTIRRILVGPGPVFRNETETIRIDHDAVTRTYRRRYTGHHLYFDTISGDRIPAPHLSDGSMLILGYLTALMNERRPNLILLEEPENGIHPRALEPFMNFFRECLTQSGIQILISSHSPYLVDYLKPEEVIMIRRESGFTEAVRLDRLPDIKQWLENLSPGELWTMGGEDELIRRIRCNEADHD